MEKYGVSLVSGVTKKLDYLVVGEDVGQAKLDKAAELNIKRLSKDEFLKLICDKSGIKEPKYDQEPDIDMAGNVEEKKIIRSTDNFGHRGKHEPLNLSTKTYIHSSEIVFSDKTFATPSAQIFVAKFSRFSATTRNILVIRKLWLNFLISEIKILTSSCFSSKKSS